MIFKTRSRKKKKRHMQAVVEVKTLEEMKLVKKETRNMVHKLKRITGNNISFELLVIVSDCKNNF